MPSNSFEQMLKTQGGFQVQQTTRILPQRQKSSGPRAGAVLSEAARSAGDRFYFAATPIAKFIYSKLEERYAALPAEHKYLKRKEALMKQAKAILNEHRNLIFEAVLPQFDVWVRSKGELLADGEDLPEADAHARDYFVKNVFHMLGRSYTAWLPEFCSAEQMESAPTTLSQLIIVQREKLENELRNYRFGFRLVVAPPR